MAQDTDRAIAKTSSINVPIKKSQTLLFEFICFLKNSMDL